MVLDYKKHRPWAEHLSIVLQLGLTMAGSIVFCFFVGRYLDRLFGLGGAMTVFFTLFGIIGGAVVCYRQIMEIVSDRSEDDKRSDRGSD